jgi:methyl-accepting chemotaxis protein
LEIVIERNVNFENKIFIPVIVLLIALLLSWFVLSTLISNVKKELKLIGDFLVKEELPTNNKNLILQEFFDSAQALVASKQEMIRNDREITQKFNSFVETSLKNINLMLRRVREIEKELKGIEGIWSRFKELFLSIFENINKMKMSNEKFENKFNESIDKSRTEIQVLKESLDLYSKGMESVETNKKMVFEKLNRITEQMGRLKELINFKNESLKYVEEIDIISLAKS